MRHESDGDANCNAYYHQTIGGLREKRTSGDHPNYNIIEIDQNTKKSLGDLRRLAVTQTPVENHQLTLVPPKKKTKRKNNFRMESSRIRGHVIHRKDISPNLRNIWIYTQTKQFSRNTRWVEVRTNYSFFLN